MLPSVSDTALQERRQKEYLASYVPVHFRKGPQKLLCNHVLVCADIIYN